MGTRHAHTGRNVTLIKDWYMWDVTLIKDWYMWDVTLIKDWYKKGCYIELGLLQKGILH